MKNYEELELKVVKFSSEDIITTSPIQTVPGVDGDDSGDWENTIIKRDY